jgi:hypothetical protein
LKRVKEMIETFLITRFNLGLDMTPWDYDAWMRKRISLFREYTLPSICQQSNQDFRWIILIDPYTPNKWIQELQDDAYELIRFNGKPFEDGMKIETAKIINKLKNPKAEKVITCRCDNDDSLHFEYISNVQKELFSRSHRSGVYFINGIQRWVDSEGKSTFYELKYPRNMFPAVIENADDIQTVFCEWHSNLDSKFQMKRVGISRMWIWNHHEYNFSNTQRTVKPRGVAVTQTEKYITDNFGVKYNE